MELFNLANDLGQNTNVTDQHPEIVQKMKADYKKYAKDVGVVIPTSGAFATLSSRITGQPTDN